MKYCKKEPKDYKKIVYIYERESSTSSELKKEIIKHQQNCTIKHH